MHKLIAYQSNLGLIFKSDGYYPADYSKFIVNGITPELVNNKWYKIPQNEIHSFKQLQCGKNTQVGWKLKKESPNIALPTNLTMQELSQVYDDDIEEMVWTGEFKSIVNLYEPVWETSDPFYEDVDFELTVVRTISIEGITNPIEMKVRSVEGNYKGTAQELDLSKIANYEEIEQILTPEFLLHERPCHLSSLSMYKIVRSYVQQNLDPKQCKITSDYDFCFTVKKIIKVKPYEVRNEKLKANLKSFNPPRYETSIVQTKEVEVFKMSHDTAGGRGLSYKGYEAIKPLYANNLKDLAEKLKSYLEDLIYNLNTPVAECQHCNGTGHIVKYQELKEIL